MCELGGQGGIDGRWHCSAAQVDILLSRHADLSSFPSSLSSLSLPLLCLFYPLLRLCICVHHSVGMLY